MKNILWWLLFILGVVAAIYVIPQILTRTLNSQNPTLTVISYSMYPALNRGDLILVKGSRGMMMEKVVEQLKKE